MSYNLLVFEPNTVPLDRNGFMKWYRKITKWKDGYDYTDPINLRPRLKEFYRLIRLKFPNMNPQHNQKLLVQDGRGIFGLFSKPKMNAVELPPEPPTDSFFTDYTFSGNAVYLAFAWSVAEDALRDVLECAINAKVGLFDVSSNNGIITQDIKKMGELLDGVPRVEPFPFSNKYIYDLLRVEGWEIIKVDDLAMASLTREGIVIKVSPAIRREASGFSLQSREGASLARYDEAYKFIAEGDMNFQPITRNFLDEKSIYHSIDENQIKTQLERIVKLFRTKDLEALNSGFSALPTDAKGAVPLRKLSAMACLGKCMELKQIHKKFKSGDRQGFMSYIQCDHIQHALEFCEISK